MPNEEMSEHANVPKKHHAHKTLHEHNTKQPQTSAPVHSNGSQINYDPVKATEVKSKFTSGDYDISDTTDTEAKKATNSMLGIK